MLLKIITTLENGTTDTDYIPLKSKISVTDPDATGSFGGRKFGFDETEIPPEETVAVVSWANGEYGPIYISKDQGAYLVGVDGKTISVIHKLAPNKVWYRKKSETTWKNMDDDKDLSMKIAYMRDHGKSYPDFEFIRVKEGIDPNDTPVQNKEAITWMMNTKGTSATWRPCSQMEYQLYRYYPDYRFVNCDPGVDPNQVKQNA